VQLGADASQNLTSPFVKLAPPACTVAERVTKFGDTTVVTAVPSEITESVVVVATVDAKTGDPIQGNAQYRNQIFDSL